MNSDTPAAPKVFSDTIITDLKILRQKSNPTTWQEVNGLDLRERLLQATTRAWCRGFGLAAIQIGIPLQYAVYSWCGRTYELLNPVIVESGFLIPFPMEGCLSIPGRRGDTMRAKEITLESDGKRFCVEGVEAVIIQHEIDHMNGILYLDKLKNPFPTLGRNDICLCGSGKKYKKCCLQ